MTEATTEPSFIAGLAGIVKRAVRTHTGMGDNHGTVRIDCFYEIFQVDVEIALPRLEEFMILLAQFGEVFSDESLKRGILYERVRGLVPSEEVSMLEIFALGKAFGLWEIVTPKEKRRNPALRHIVFDDAQVGSIGIIRL